MGVACSSRKSSSVIATVKVVLDDGRLRKFSCPVKTSVVLEKLRNESSNGIIESFICNSDEMEFGGLFTAVDDEEELRPNQIYFLLPIKWLKRRITAEYMAALAVKASSAIATSGGGRGWCRGKEELLVVWGEKDVRSVRPLTVVGGGGGYARLNDTVGGYHGGDRRLVERTIKRDGAGGRHGSFRGGDIITTLAVVAEEE